MRIATFMALLALLASTTAAATTYTYFGPDFDPTQNYSDNGSGSNCNGIPVVSPTRYECIWAKGDVHAVMTQMRVPPAHGSDDVPILINIQPGAIVHIAGGQNLIFDQARLVINGTIDEPVVFQGDGEGAFLTFKGMTPSFADLTRATTDNGISRIVARKLQVLFDGLTNTDATTPFLVKDLVLEDFGVNGLGVTVTAGAYVRFTELILRNTTRDGGGLTALTVENAAVTEIDGLAISNVRVSRTLNGIASGLVAINVTSFAKLTLNSATISGNWGEDFFHALLAVDATLTSVKDLTIEANTTKPTNPLFGIVVEGYSSATILDSTIRGQPDQVNSTDPQKGVLDAAILVKDLGGTQPVATITAVKVAGAFDGVVLKGPAASVKVRRSRFATIQRSAVRQESDSLTNIVVENNYVTGPPAQGLDLIYVRKGFVRFNTVNCNGISDTGIYSGSSAAGDKMVITGNIVVNCKTAGIRYYSNNDTLDQNFVFGTTNGCHYQNKFGIATCVDVAALPGQSATNYVLDPKLNGEGEPTVDSPAQLFDLTVPDTERPGGDIWGNPRILLPDAGAFEEVILTEISPDKVRQGDGPVPMLIRGYNLSGVDLLLHVMSGDSLDPGFTSNPTELNSDAPGRNADGTFELVATTATPGARTLVVRIGDGLGQFRESTWTDALTVVANQAPPKPVLSSPEPDVIVTHGSNLPLMVTAVADPEGDPITVDIEISADDFKSVLSGSAYDLTPDAASMEVVAPFVANLPEGPYKWRARAKDNRGAASVWVVRSFTVKNEIIIADADAGEVEEPEVETPDLGAELPESDQPDQVAADLDDPDADLPDSPAPDLATPDAEPTADLDSVSTDLTTAVDSVSTDLTVAVDMVSTDTTADFSIPETTPPDTAADSGSGKTDKATMPTYVGGGGCDIGIGIGDAAPSSALWLLLLCGWLWRRREPRFPGI